MANMSLKKVRMNEQPGLIRVKNFGEVAQGYTLEQAKEEAARCLNCKTKPCVKGCPVNVPIPEFIQSIMDEDLVKAYSIITKENKMPAVCGRVCPQEKQCEGQCVRAVKGEAVGIGRLERFVADEVQKLNLDRPVANEEKNGVKVAVVGSGPASLTCAGELAVLGYDVTMFEALHELGGVLMYGIPEFRLPKALVKREIDNIIALGVNINKNVIVGKSVTVEELIEDGYQAVFIGSGAGLPNFLSIPGENFNGVYSANEFLTRVNLMKAYDFPNNPTPVRIGTKVAVIGGGNVAMDAARTAARIGAEEVYIVYRRGEEELPARLEEIEHAKEEGIRFKLLSNPEEIIGENFQVVGLRCQQMTLGDADASGRRKPVPVVGEQFVLSVDSVIVAVGQTPNPLIKETTPAIEVNKRGCLVVNSATMETNIPNVFAGGDVVTGAATVILAMGTGKIAAQTIHDRFSAK